jgi:hypothetical protein
MAIQGERPTHDGQFSKKIGAVGASSVSASRMNLPAPGDGLLAADQRREATLAGNVDPMARPAGNTKKAVVEATTA